MKIGDVIKQKISHIKAFVVLFFMFFLLKSQFQPYEIEI